MKHELKQEQHTVNQGPYAVMENVYSEIAIVRDDANLF
jgi:hypothetical protein